jgi:hypothetical protein
MDIKLKYRDWVDEKHANIASPLTNSDIETFAIEFAEAYHEAKLKEITDADIEAWAEKEFGDSMIIPEQAAIAGAKAALNGEIKHIE